MIHGVFIWPRLRANGARGGRQTCVGDRESADAGSCRARPSRAGARTGRTHLARSELRAHGLPHGRERTASQHTGRTRPSALAPVLAQGGHRAGMQRQPPRFPGLRLPAPSTHPAPDRRRRPGSARPRTIGIDPVGGGDQPEQRLIRQRSQPRRGSQPSLLPARRSVISRSV